MSFEENNRMKPRYTLHCCLVLAFALALATATLLPLTAQSPDTRWSLGGFYRAKAVYALSVQNSICGGECDYMLSMLPVGELGASALYQIQPTLGVMLDLSWNAHGYSYKAAYTQSSGTDNTTPQYSVSARYCAIAPSIVLQEQDSSGLAWRWFAGVGLGIPLAVTLTRSDIAADGSVTSDRYLYPAVRTLEPLVDVRLGALIPLGWKGLHMSAVLNYNVSNFFKTSDSYGSAVERANALGIALGVEYLIPLQGRK
jgi:hypothetical protein